MHQHGQEDKGTDKTENEKDNFNVNKPEYQNVDDGRFDVRFDWIGIRFSNDELVVSE